MDKSRSRSKLEHLINKSLYKLYMQLSTGVISLITINVLNYD